MNRKQHYKQKKKVCLLSCKQDTSKLDCVFSECVTRSVKGEIDFFFLPC